MPAASGLAGEEVAAAAAHSAGATIDQARAIAQAAAKHARVPHGDAHAAAPTCDAAITAAAGVAVMEGLDVATARDAGLAAAQAAWRVAKASANQHDVMPVYPVLLSAGGDAPFASKTRCACGHAAATACYRCFALGSKRGNAPTATAPGIGDGRSLSSTAFAGYAAPCFKQSFSLPAEGEARCGRAWGERAELVYERAGRFDRTAADEAAISDEVAILLGQLAESYTRESYAKFEEERAALVAAAERENRRVDSAGVLLRACSSATAHCEPTSCSTS